MRKQGKYLEESLVSGADDNFDDFVTVEKQTDDIFQILKFKKYCINSLNILNPNSGIDLLKPVYFNGLQCDPLQTMCCCW